ncbi:hypothetical protein GPA10_09420 [Streptomyces sp. p1417]|uniref:Uncharacterized protein n=1 Tax=Streptomyces typhae TaxID=2681492 RepID=A0A6L6WWJ4_9ACTN|nr:hypothetical protein [Streptomyces typhae]MVO84976.1 hypothetical protein [Streptomyces typhae]
MFTRFVALRASPLGELIYLGRVSRFGPPGVPVEDDTWAEAIKFLVQGVDEVAPSWGKDVDDHDVASALVDVHGHVRELVAAEIVQVAPQPDVNLLHVVCRNSMDRVLIDSDQEVGVASGPLLRHVGYPVGETEL